MCARIEDSSLATHPVPHRAAATATVPFTSSSSVVANRGERFHFDERHHEVRPIVWRGVSHLSA
jgi:hypothetical protein